MSSIDVNVGDFIAGVEVIETIPALKKRDYRYRIKYTCCNAEAVMSHKNLLDRLRHARLTCYRCVKGTSNPAISGRKPKPFIAYKPGFKGGGVEVIKKVEGTMRSTAVYLVQYKCCEREDTLSHSALENRMRSNLEVCRYCAAKKQTQGRFVPKGPKLKGLTDNLGYFWPKLGKLGIRGSY